MTTLSDRSAKLLEFNENDVKANYHQCTHLRTILRPDSYAETFNLGAKYQSDRLKPILNALIECVDALEELNDILSDYYAKSEIDSFTGQPARIALAELEEIVEKMER